MPGSTGLPSIGSTGGVLEPPGAVLPPPEPVSPPGAPEPEPESPPLPAASPTVSPTVPSPAPGASLDGMASLPALNGFFSLKTSRCDPATELASSVTAGSWPSFDVTAAVVGGGVEDAGLSSTTGTATIAAKRATATGQRRLA